MPLRYHMHCRKGKKPKFGSVTFLLCGVCLHPLLLGDWVFCMVNGLQASRSVDSQNMFEVGMVKVLAPVVNLD